ncbi:MAG TPA: EAL domain-containing protein [Hyphomicrobiales bacterium]|jgi:diguanylate cyclase (GGDEF)-like protein
MQVKSEMMSDTTRFDAIGTEPAAEAAPRILVVDDVEDNRDILSRRLVRSGFEVVEASGGHDALEKIAREHFDLVLLDIMMPDLNGNEVLRRVRSTYSDTELPVIMVTAKCQSEDVVDSINIGANDYVTKPVDFSVALVRINAQIDRKRRSDAELVARHELEEKNRSLDSTVEEKSKELLETATLLEREVYLRMHSEERLHFLAFHDSLTELQNRQAFRDAMLDALDNMPIKDREPVLVFIDLDHFKIVNDTHGHGVGDALLKAVAHRLREIVGEKAPLARLGGDEFAAIIEVDKDADNVVEIAERIVDGLSREFFIDGKTLRIGASCGVARASTSNFDLDELIRSADLAMYHAKRKGRGGAVQFETKMLDEHLERRCLEDDLSLAVRYGGLEVFYQPLLDAASQSIVGFEALCRWSHPKRGMISPEVFIPLAEEIGLIDEIGAWVMRTACNQAATWPPYIGIAINVSPLQFRSPSFLPTLVNILGSSGIAPSRMELEITESALLGSESYNLSMLQAIRELGVKISIDDFGTGYSSLGYLQSFQFDKIKIDRRFVQQFQSGLNDGAIVQAILDLSAQLGIRTIAEGIETQEQFTSMVRQGCHEVQGYLFSRPLTAADATKFLNRLEQKAS